MALLLAGAANADVLQADQMLACSVDAGQVITSAIDTRTNAGFAMTAHGTSSYTPFVFNVEPQDTRDIETYQWFNGGDEYMGLVTASYYRSPVLRVHGNLSLSGALTNTLGGSIAPIYVTSNLPADYDTSAVLFNQTNPRAGAQTGQCQYTFQNGGATEACFFVPPVLPFPQEVGEFEVMGRTWAYGDPHHAAFNVIQNGSGTSAMECADQGSGCYLPFTTHMANGSSHGALTVVNAVNYPDGGFKMNMDGGLMLELRNPNALGYAPNTSYDSVFEVDAFGGFGNGFRAATLGAGAHQLPQACDHHALPNEIGHGSSTGYLNFANDTNHYYLTKCGDLPDGGDTGYDQLIDAKSVTKLVGTLSGVGTAGPFGVSSSAICTCTDQTDGSSIICPVSGTSVTLTGWAAHAFTGICL